jgi:hypothetical protein
MGNELNRKVSQKERKMAYKYMKKLSTYLMIKEMQVKTTLRFYFTLVKMTIINNMNNNKCWAGFKEKKCLSTTGRDIN